MDRSRRRWSRRGFVGTLTAAPMLGHAIVRADQAASDAAMRGSSSPVPASVSHAGAEADAAANGVARPIRLMGDGLLLSPVEQAALLAKLTTAGPVTADEYGLGGAVQDLERWFAQALAKERAVFMPTGTLANHIAIRTLAGSRARVLVQDTSHVYNDTGDACQQLSHLNLVPLAPGKATFTRDEVERVLAQTAGGRVASEVGAISIESPVRRRRGELFDFAEMKRIAALAREKGIGLHLDGARLFLATAYTGVSPAEYASLFDTVYVSLWKYFNAPNGAILAGPARLIDGLFHVRRMFGGALWSAWPFALVARHYAEGFLDRFAAAVAVSKAFGAALPPPFELEAIPGGSHQFYVRAPGVDVARLRERLAAAGIRVPEPMTHEGDPALLLGVNETWNTTTGAALAEAFQRAAR